MNLRPDFVEPLWYDLKLASVIRGLMLTGFLGHTLYFSSFATLLPFVIYTACSTTAQSPVSNGPQTDITHKSDFRPSYGRTLVQVAWWRSAAYDQSYSHLLTLFHLSTGGDSGLPHVPGGMEIDRK